MLRLFAIVCALYAIRWLLYAFVTEPWIVIAMQERMPSRMPRCGCCPSNCVIAPSPAAGGDGSGAAWHGVPWPGRPRGRDERRSASEAYGGTGMYLYGFVCAAVSTVGFGIWPSGAVALSVCGARHRRQQTIRLEVIQKLEVDQKVRF